MRILMPSIIDPATFRGGAGTATRSMLSILEAEPLAAQVDLIPSDISNNSILHAMRRITSLARSMYSPLSSKTLFHYTHTFQSRVRKALATNAYDLVLVNGSDLLWVLDLVDSKLPVVVWAHNLEHELFARQLDSVRLPALMRSVFMSDLHKLEDYEMQGLTRATGTIFISSIEADRMSSHLGSSRVLCVPPLFVHSPEPERRLRGSTGRIELGFLANLAWWPNRDGLNWFLEKVLPHCGAGVRLNLFGVGSEKYNSMQSASVVGHGYVPDIQSVWNSCDVMICPIRNGGGVNIKLAEAIYNAMPVLATPFAVGGLPLDTCSAVVIAESSDEWVEILCSQVLLDDLASAEVTSEQRDQFAASHHMAAIHEYFFEAASVKI
jgi:glycosyltransferase involved in cell wall biosynthesis